MKNNSLISFPVPVLFLEFFVREVTYYGPDQSAQFPPGTLFYTGESMAAPGDLPGWGEFLFREKPGSPLPVKNGMGMLHERPCLLKSQASNLRALLETCAPDAFLLIGREAWHEDRWMRENDRLHYTCLLREIPRGAGVADRAPFRFGVWLQDEQGNLLTDFPESEVRQLLEVGQTYLFMCRQEQYANEEFVTPNRNLCLFVKNHGLKTGIHLVSEAEMGRYDQANLCKEPINVRDHRKSRYKYILG